MNIVYWNEKPSYKLGILIKESYLNADNIHKYYLKEINQDDVIAFGLYYDNTNKVSANKAKEFIQKLVKPITALGITHLYVADVAYFKILTKQKKADIHYGSILPCMFKGLEHIRICLGVNYGQLMYNPNLADRTDFTLNALKQSLDGSYKPIEHDVELVLPNSADEIINALEALYRHPMLTCDIETYGLQLQSGMATISFSYNEYHATVFKTKGCEKLIKQFFEAYKGILIYHNASFDIKHIIFNCFMKHPLDYRGMLYGLDTMTRHIHDTKVIAYLATNSTAGNELGLKALSLPFMGDYAQDVKDITNLSDEQLLTYNGKDTCATWFVFNKYYVRMLQDNQLDIYNTVMLPSLKVIIQMELCGMPMDINKVYEVANELETIQTDYLEHILNNPYVKQAQLALQHIKLDKINDKLKTKQHTLQKVADEKFNPNSNHQLSYLLYDVLGLPILDKTKSGQPACDTSTIEKLLNHTDEHKALLSDLIGLNKVNKILTSFIPHFKDSFKKANGNYLHGSFNLGGTLSGRLSSSKPNLQNLPSGSEYGKLIKSCFKAPKGWLMVGADFSSLEDRINALLTKDTNKLKVYTDGYDGHSLRAYYYFKEQMKEISQATDDDKCYCVKAGHNTIYFKHTDTIKYKDKTYSGEKFYELVTNQRL